MARVKKRHRWKRAPGGHSCTACGMFKATDGICFPAGGKRAIDSRKRGVPQCRPINLIPNVPPGEPGPPQEFEW